MFFDVFGTTVDWRSSVTKALYSQAQSTLSPANNRTPPDVKQKASDLSLEDWGRFAAEWRASYYAFTKSIAQNPDAPYKDIDEHHLDSLRELLEKWQLNGLWNEQQVVEMSLIWHKLDPWPDTVEGIQTLNKRFTTCTLSNGTVKLLTDMAEHAHLEWTDVFSSNMFGTYKPNPKVYKGAAKKLGLEVEECGMVAAHLGDLRAAKDCGFFVVYVEREREEAWEEGDVEEARREGWVDVWVGKEDGGFLEVARRLGVVEN